MFNKKKFLGATLLGLTMFLTMGITANASTQSNAIENSITPYVSDMTGYEYIPSTKSYNSRVDWRHVATNSVNGTTDTISRSVSRTLSTTLNSSVSATVNGVVAQAGASFEVGIGASTTQTTTATFSIPYGTYECQYGSKLAYVSGTQKYWSNGYLQSSKSISGNWSYSSFTNKVKK